MALAESQATAGPVQVTYSSFIEMLLSLDLLYAPQQHGVLHPWVVRLKEKVPRRFYDQIAAFGDALGGWQPLARLAVRVTTDDLTTAAMLERLEALPDEEFRRLLAESPDELGATRLDRPALPSWRRRLMDFLNDYWVDIFRDEFYWIEPLCQRSQQDSDRRIIRGELRPLIDSLFAGRIDFEPADFERIVLLPSVFGVPDSVLDLWQGQLALIYTLAPTGAVVRDELAPPELLSRLLKALGDESRLKIMKLILERPRCTQELAQELALSEPTVSKHLKVLREADLVTHKKDGNFVLYSLKLERVTELQMRILDFLRS